MVMSFSSERRPRRSVAVSFVTKIASPNPHALMWINLAGTRLATPTDARSRAHVTPAALALPCLSRVIFEHIRKPAAS